jgi:16S rRNA (guanine527-N7)-methyltransferase
MMEKVLTEGLSALGLPSDGIPSLMRYGELLMEKNRVMNLTAITQPDEIATLHFLDSLELLHDFDFQNHSMVDVGTGAGFPGLPMRIAEPSLHVTLLDSQGKRVTFLQEVCRELNLPDVVCIHDRAEEFAQKNPAVFDFAVSRAVAALPVLCELCIPMVRIGGAFLAMKSTGCDEELKSAEHAIALLGGSVRQIRDYQIPGTEIRHRIIEIRKISPTPEKYPRSFAKIKKSPL